MKSRRITAALLLAACGAGRCSPTKPCSSLRHGSDTPRSSAIFRDMDNDYGMVCMPKFLESSDYMTLVYDGTTVFVPPITSR